MTTLTDYLLQERSVEHADSVLIDLGRRACARFSSSRNVMLHLVLQGSLFIRLDRSQRSFELRAGDYAILFYGDAHSIDGSADDETAGVETIAFGDTGDAPPLLSLREGSGLAARVASMSISLIHAVPARPSCPTPELHIFRREPDEDSMDHALPIDIAQLAGLCNGPGATAFLSALANLCIFQGIRACHGKASQLYRVSLEKARSDTTSALLRIMQTQFDKQWTIRMLANKVGLSRSSLAEKFRDHVGVSPIEYLTDVRMKHAVELLCAEDPPPLWEISRRIGYKSESSFARAFKTRFGVSPRAYSRQSGGLDFAHQT
ncbi:MAG: AraC family transcriptional regulator [Caulobacterales bacterium]